MQRASVEAALARIEEPKPFALSLRMKRFLRFTVERALAGERDALKECTISVEVFSRTADSDPRIDSIVQRALELNPSLVAARIYYASTVMAPLGRFAEALAHLNAARLLDPVSVVLSTAMGMVHYLRHHATAAVEELRQAISLNSEYYGAHRFLAFAMHGLGETAAAIRLLEDVRYLAADDPRISGALGYLNGAAGQPDSARKVWEEFDTIATRGYVASYDRALVYLGLGQLDTACRLLTEACTEHEPWLALVRADPVFLPLKGMPAFESLLARIFHQGE